jgi:hypothetical protein
VAPFLIPNVISADFIAPDSIVGFDDFSMFVDLIQFRGRPSWRHDP